MAFTRFHDDDARIMKQLQQSTGPARWILNVPGNGPKPAYMADPQIRIQSWGGNLMTNSVNLESELLGINRPLNHDCLGKNLFTDPKNQVETQKISYPTCKDLTTGQSRVTNPAWMYRDLEQVDWYSLPLNPQENTCMPFQNNLSTRILEKDYFVQKIDCNVNSELFPLPLPSEENDNPIDSKRKQNQNKNQR
jgi:hypothetical protein